MDKKDLKKYYVAIKDKRRIPEKYQRSASITLGLTKAEKVILYRRLNDNIKPKESFTDVLFRLLGLPTLNKVPINKEEEKKIEELKKEAELDDFLTGLIEDDSIYTYSDIPNENDIKAIIGKEFKKAREKKGVSLKDVEKEIKIDGSSYSKFERGEKKVQVYNQLRLCRYYGIKISDIYKKLNSYI